MPYKDIRLKRANDRAYWRKIKGAGPAPAQLPIGVVQNLVIKGPKEGLKVAVIPDVQEKDLHAAFRYVFPFSRPMR